MIEDETVLILGAGASASYDFPTGGQLRDFILNDLLKPDKLDRAENGRHGADLKRLLDHHSVDDLRDFRERFFYSSRSSIDLFLRENLSLRDLGKRIIAVSLITKENEHTLFSRTNWYQYLLNYMLSIPSIHAFGENKLKIITFNYDRSVEHFFYRALQNGFEEAPAVAAAEASRIPVYHIHGLLGIYDQDQDDSVCGTRSFKTSLDADPFDAAAALIKIFSEATHEDTLRHPHLALRSAKKIGFLGFGYDPINLGKIFCEESNWFVNAEVIAGTTRGLPPGESERVSASILGRAGKQFQAHNGDCLSFLRDTNFLAPL